MTLALTPLPDEALVHLRGAKIPDFLQGQLTCDLRALAPGRAIAGAMCNIKGRVLSDLWVVAVDESHCLLRLRRAVATPFAANLRRYAQFSRIEVAEDSRPQAVTGLVGDGEVLEDLCGPDPGACRAEGDFIVLRRGFSCAEAIALPQAADREFPAPSGTSADAAPAASWYYRELREGHYAIDGDDWERFTPQALNYDRRGRVAFDKGCYTGQEVVARLHYKGEAKRRLAVLQCSAEGDIAPGDAVMAGDGGREGEVLRSLPGAGEDPRLVAALVSSARAGESLELEDGRALRPVTETP